MDHKNAPPPSNGTHASRPGAAPEKDTEDTIRAFLAQTPAPVKAFASGFLRTLDEDLAAAEEATRRRAATLAKARSGVVVLRSLLAL